LELLRHGKRLIIDVHGLGEPALGGEDVRFAAQRLIQ